MKLFLTGTIPAWVLLPFLGILVAVTLLVYRRHRLPKPWNTWLPAIRIAVFALLVLALFQPVATRVRSTRIRGQIPVIVDTSGSMSLVDTYPVARQVAIAWRMGLFERKLRNLDFLDIAEKSRDLQDSIADTDRQRAALASRLRARTSWSREFSRDVKDFAGGVRDIAEQIEATRKSVVTSVRETGYLASSETLGVGRLRMRRYDSIPGTSVAELAKHAKYPASPDFTGALDAFGTTRNSGDDYAVLVHGWLSPPVSGGYVFTLASDDTAELYLGTGPDPGTKKKIASSNNTSVRTPAIALQKGSRYYVEAVGKEGQGDDYLEVGWQRPDGKTESPVPGAFFSATREIDAFTSAYADFKAMMSGSATELNRLAEAIDDTNKARLKDPPTLVRLLAQFREHASTCSRATDALENLQREADARLAAAGIKEVDESLHRLSGMSRLDLAKFVLTREPYNLVRRLEKRGEVAIFSLEEDADAVKPSEIDAISAGLPSTRLGSAVSGVLKRYEKEPVAAVVILTDGRNNAGKSIHAVTESLRERGIPAFSFGVGSTVPPPDIAIERVLAPRTSFLEDRLNVVVMLRRHGYTDRAIKLGIRRDGKLLKETTVEPGEDTQVLVDLSFVEKNGGPHAYTVSAQHFDSEAVEHNNRRTFAVNILEDRIRTLLVDEFPRWESRYVNMMLKRDKRVDLTTIFVASTPNNALPLKPSTSDAAAVADGQEDYFPSSRQELFGYHIVILGDVNPAHFTRDQLYALKAFVIERGGTLIAMAGEHYMPARYSGTPLADLIPLRRMPGRTTHGRFYDARTDPKAPFAHSGRFRLGVAEFAEHDDVTQIGATPEMSKELWENLPRLNWIREGPAAALSADLLVTGIDARHAGTRRSLTMNASPVVVKMYAGLGKVMYLGSDEFWRWRCRARWTYHHRFWGQILLWSTMGRTTGFDSRVKLMADRPAYAPEETVRIKARILDNAGAPVDDADAMLEVCPVEDSGDTGPPVKIVPLLHLEGSGGEYRAQIRDLPRGRYRAIPRVSELRDAEKADVVFDVRDLSTTEYTDLAMDELLLQGLSKRYSRFEKALDMVEDVPEVDSEEEHRADTELWDTFPFLVLIAGLLGFEWVMRKKHKLA